jgi:hypothetical protein
MDLFTVIDGKTFNIINKNKKFVKLTNQTEIHNEYQFKDGLNIDTVKFNPQDKCKAGGFYFIEEKKFKSDKIFLCERKEIFNDYELCKQMIKKDGYIIKYIENPSIELCKLALEETEYSIQYIKNPTKEILLDVLKKNPRITEYLKKYFMSYLNDIEICENIGKWYFDDIKFISDPINQTPIFCESLVKKNGLFLKYIKDKTPELCRLAVEQNSNALRFIKDQIPELCEIAVKNDGNAIRFIKDQIPELCEIALKQNIGAMKYIWKKFKYNV